MIIKKLKYAHKDESGVALIAVLCMMITAAVLVASAVAISQYAALDTATFCAYGKSFYLAESAANRARWMLYLDRKHFPNRTIGKTRGMDTTRWLADGHAHKITIDGQVVTVQIEDAAQGYNINGGAPASELRKKQKTSFYDSEQRGSFKDFCDQLNMYAEPNAIVLSSGGIEEQYLSRGLFNMPRLAPLQFREEIYYIPGAIRRFKPDAIGRISGFNVIPPRYMRQISSKPNLLAVPLGLIKGWCELSDEETREVSKALQLWHKQRVPLQNSISGILMGKLERNFSLRESGIYSILVKTASKQYPGVVLNCILSLSSSKLNKTEYYSYTYY